MSLEAGQVLDGKYRIKRLIGEGGMGAVYEGENLRIQRRVAIKVVHPAFASDTAVMARFQREAQAAGRIGNDHILEVLDLGALDDGSQYMVLEFLDGEPLTKRVERLGRFTPEVLAPLVLQMLQGLGAAHNAGIFHRDLKPDNIFILKQKAGRPDFVKIIDFGISKFQPLSGDGMKMTSTGAVMGTPYYMSPEQASGSHTVDARSDLYAMGVILYECVTGRIPFEGDTFNQLMFKIVLSDPTPPQEVVPDLDRAFATIISKAMARDVAQRFQTADEFTKAITAWMDKGTEVAAVVPPSENEALARGAARNAFASASGQNAVVPGLTAREATSANLRPQATGGSWATSQFGVPPPRNTVLLAAVAGGLLLAVALVVGVVTLRSGGAPAASSSALGGSGSAAVAAPAISALAPSVATPPPAPSTVVVSPAAPSAEPPKEELAASNPARRSAPGKTVPKAPAKGPPAKGPPPGPAAKPAGGGEPYFGY